MKKSVIVLFVFAALFLVGSCALFSQGDIGSGVFGLVAAAILGAIGYFKLKKQKAEIAQFNENARLEREEAARKESEEAERRRAWQETHSAEMFKVAGVTYNNDDGSSRQSALKRIVKESGGVTTAVELEEYDFDGKPAIRVILEGDCVGNIPATDVKRLLDLEKQGISYMEALVEDFENDDEKTVYYCTLSITYEK